MSSINTNHSALVALQNLKYTNKNLAQVQNEVSTGKHVADAKDDPAIWAVSSVIETDIQSFKTISSSLNLGGATVGTARNAAEKVKEAVEGIKDKIERAQEENIDRSKLQTEIDNHRDEIKTFIAAAQYNGLNLLTGGDDLNILASLNRTKSGVTPSYIAVERFNLGTEKDVLGTGAALTGVPGAVTATAAIAAAPGATPPTAAIPGTVTIAAGAVETSNEPGKSTGFSLTIGADTVEYVLRVGENQNDAIKALVARFNELGHSNIKLTANTVVDPLTTAATITVEETTGAALAASGEARAASSVGGELNGIETIDVTTDEGAQAALRQIERFIQATIDTAAHFGSAEKRIENQDSFVSDLVDSLTVGVSALVDTDLEEASARLKSLQVQQQLGVQALSIANETPQQLLALFR